MTKEERAAIETSELFKEMERKTDELDKKALELHGNVFGLDGPFGREKRKIMEETEKKRKKY